jgi:hypothetical protein
MLSRIRPGFKNFFFFTIPGKKKCPGFKPKQLQGREGAMEGGKEK